MEQGNQLQPSVAASVSAESISRNIETKEANSVIDKNFPLFLSVFQTAHIPIIFIYPFLVMFFVQVLIVSVWPWSHYWMHHQEQNVMKWTQTVLFFVPKPSQPVHYLITSAVIFAINLIILFIIEIQIAYYNISRKFIKVLNYPIRLYFDGILVASLTPCIVGAGETFLQIAYGSTSWMHILSMVLFLLSVAYESYSFVIVQNFASKSTCINVSPLLNFDPTIMVITLIALLTTVIPFFILQMFEHWATIVAVVGNICMYSYCLFYMVLNIPLCDPMTMGLSGGWFIGCLYGDVVTIVGHFKHDMSWKIPYLGSFIVFFCCVPPSLVFFLLRIKFVVKKLKVEFTKNEEAYEYFKEIGMENNLSRALCYLKIGFQYYCPTFYTWQMMNFIIDKYDDELAVSTCLQLLSYFPKETRLQGKLEKILRMRRTLKYHTRFLLFQVEAIKSLRQFSVSAQAKLKLIELKNMSRHLEMMSRSGIDSDKLGTMYLQAMAIKAISARAIWDEALLSAPNNPKYCEEYARYLIDAECDFPAGLKMKNRQQIIEMGKSFSVDFAFRSMVIAFPKYLTDNILDLNGAVIHLKKENPNKTSGSTTGSTGNVSLENSLDGADGLDAEVEEYIGKQSIRLARVRLALHRMLENKLPRSIKAINLAILFIMAFMIITFTIGCIKALVQLKHVVVDMRQMDAISKTRFYIALSNVNIVSEYYREKGKLQQYVTYIETLIQPDDILFVNFSTDMKPGVINFTTKSSTAFQSLIEMLSEMANERQVQVLDYASDLIRRKTYFMSCPWYVNTTASLANIISMFLADQRELGGMPNLNGLMEDPNACELSLNFLQYFYKVTDLYAEIADAQYDTGEYLNGYFGMLSYMVPILTAVAVFVPLVIVYFLIYRSMRKLVKIIHSLDAKAKQDAKGLISIQVADDDSRLADMNEGANYSTFLVICICIIACIFLILTYFGSNIVLQTSKHLINLNAWNMFATQRLSLSAETLNAIITVMLVHSFPTEYKIGNISTMNYILKLLSDELVKADNNLVNGYGAYPPCQGYDDELDQLNIYNQEIPENVSEPAEYYSKLCIHSEIDTLIHYIHQIQAESFMRGELSVTNVGNALYLSNYILFMKCVNVCKRIMELGQLEYSKLIKNLIILCVFTIIALFLFIMLMLTYLFNRSITYKAGLMLIKRFSPYALLNNKLFGEVFLKGKGANKNEKLSIEGSIIKNANDPIFCTNINGTVEIINNITSSILGYTPEQILGQHVASFFVTKDQDTLMQKLEMMRSGQASAYADEDLVAVTDSLSEIPVHVTIIGMKKESETNVNSFVIILRDQTNLVNQKKAAEEAKAKSEKLLYQILPRDIVVQLNRGDKDISFVVPSATIVFIDINKFSEYAANLSPQDIMSNLSLYFANIDKVAQKYNMLQKIKLIGDIYMAATGLFNPDAAPETHAEQTINFSVECINSLEEINIRLESNLQIRIGVNTGGPVIAGVLGTDKPVFDIIGDPINVAARLQSTSDVNRVHISQATYELVKAMNFEITPRGETFLKGKGKQMTYYATSVATGLNGTGTFTIH